MKPFLLMLAFSLCASGQPAIKQQPKKAKQFRVLTTGGAATIDITSGAEIFNAGEADIDVSYDGSHWQHFFGKTCLHNNPRGVGKEPPNEWGDKWVSYGDRGVDAQSPDVNYKDILYCGPRTDEACVSYPVYPPLEYTVPWGMVDDSVAMRRIDAQFDPLIYTAWPSHDGFEGGQNHPEYSGNPDKAIMHYTVYGKDNPSGLASVTLGADGVVTIRLGSYWFANVGETVKITKVIVIPESK